MNNKISQRVEITNEQITNSRIDHILLNKDQMDNQLFAYINTNYPISTSINEDEEKITLYRDIFVFNREELLNFVEQIKNERENKS